MSGRGSYRHSSSRPARESDESDVPGTYGPWHGLGNQFCAALASDTNCATQQRGATPASDPCYPLAQSSLRRCFRIKLIAMAGPEAQSNGDEKMNARAVVYRVPRRWPQRRADSTSIYKSIVETTYNTPLVQLRLPSVRLAEGTRILLKLEFLNPAFSVKDRSGRSMIEAAEVSGRLRPGMHIVEPTSGNTGIALAFVAASRGYRLTLTMPESMSRERRAILHALGANIVLTPMADGMQGAVNKAETLLDLTPGSWSPRQFENPANPAVHESTTGPEIWRDTGGSVDVFVAGVGTGGTITGVTRFLKSKSLHVKAIAVEPKNSPILSGGKLGSHKIQGIGPGFVPKNLDRALLSGIETVTDEEAFEWARRISRDAGILGGISTGANVAATVRLASRPENAGKTFVTIAASSGERYLSAELYPRFEDPAPPSLIERAFSLGYSI